MVSRRLVCKFLLDIIYPNRCPVCHKVIKWNELICHKCEESLPFIDIDLCEKCGKDVCLDHVLLNFDCVYTVIRYEGSGRDGVINLKSKNGLNFAEYFAEKLYEVLLDREVADKIDVITAVPMFKRKKQERGYNQAEILADFLSERLNKPTDYRLLKRHDTEFAQHELSQSQREEFAEKSYYINEKHKDINGKTILLCDDVYTTGATMNKCSALLKEMGAKKVICVAIATTLLKKSDENE
ncbi:MAG: ComF family protein [Hominimerdicola sp.]